MIFKYNLVLERILSLEFYFYSHNISKVYDYFPFFRLVLWRRVNLFRFSLFNDFIHCIFYFSKICFLLIQYLIFNRFLNCFILTKKSSNSDIFIYSPQTYYNQTINNKSFSRIIDPFISFVSDYFSYDKFSFLLRENRYIPSIIINQRPFLHFSILRDLHFDFRSIYNYAYFFKINQILLLLSVYHEFLKTHAFKNLFVLLLNQNKYKFIVTTCYYDPPQMGLIWAARLSQIISFDLQHGKQGPYHLMYNGLKNVPLGGYNVIPDFFLTWGNLFTQNILRHSFFHKNHKPKTLGNLWIDYAYKFFVSSNRNALPSDKKLVLVTLQDESSQNHVVPHFIEESIDELMDFYWIFRVHPNFQNTSSFVNDFVSKHSNCINSSDLESDNTYSLLHLCDFHISSYSTVVLESIYFGLPTAVWSKRGFLSFEHEIKEEDVSVLDSKGSLIRFFDKKFIKKINHKYFAQPSKELFRNFMIELID